MAENPRSGQPTKSFQAPSKGNKLNFLLIICLGVNACAINPDKRIDKVQQDIQRRKLNQTDDKAADKRTALIHDHAEP